MAEVLHGKATGAAFLAWFFFDHLGKAETWQDRSLSAAFPDSAVLRRLAQEGLRHHMIGLAGGDLRPLSLAREILVPSKMLLVNPLVYADDNVRDEQAADRVLPFAVRFSFGSASTGKPTIAYVDLPYMDDEEKPGVLSAAAALAKGRLSTSELAELEETAQLVALRLRATCQQSGVDLAAGSLRFAVTGAAGAMPRQLMLVDALGPDTLHMYIGATPLSLDVLNDSYRNSHWLMAIEKAKALAAEREERDWKRICIEEFKGHPPLLSPILKEKAVMIYQSLAREFSQRHYGQAVFPKAWDLPRLSQSLAVKRQAVG
jgi:hypothetical protein